jgi:hypothetical protein
MTRLSWLRSALAAGVLVLSFGSSINAVTAGEVAFVLRVVNGRLPENMRLIRVKQNDVVKLEWSTDKPMSIHLHGYDIETAVAPGAVSEMTFTARAAGRFTVEPHLAQGPAGGHAHGDILVTIEVYP